MVNHNNSICIYIGLNISNYTASGTQFIYLLSGLCVVLKQIMNYRYEDPSPMAFCV